MWTAPLSSSLSVENVSAPKVWVGGPSKKESALSSTFNPLLPLNFGECDAGRDGECKYWYGGALTDLQFHQNLVTTNQQGKELVDAPSMALPIAILLGTNSGGAPFGLSFVQSALDHPVSMTLVTQQAANRHPPAPFPPGGGCDATPQPCPAHKGRTFCSNVHVPGQCGKPPSPAPAHHQPRPLHAPPRSRAFLLSNRKSAGTHNISSPSLHAFCAS